MFRSILTLVGFMILIHHQIHAQTIDSMKTSDFDTDDIIISYIEYAPVFPGGNDSLIKYLHSSISIPKDSIVNGQVFVQFWIDTTGYAIDCRIIRGINNLQDKEALRIINEMPNWKPGEQRGKKIKVPYTIPIRFGEDKN